MNERVWPGVDGQPIACRDKLKTLTENEAEVQQVLQDAFEDAILMGVDETAMRNSMVTLVTGLKSPKRAR